MCGFYSLFYSSRFPYVTKPWRLGRSLIAKTSREYLLFRHWRLYRVAGHERYVPRLTTVGPQRRCAWRRRAPAPYRRPKFILLWSEEGAQRAWYQFCAAAVRAAIGKFEGTGAGMGLSSRPARSHGAESASAAVRVKLDLDPSRGRKTCRMQHQTCRRVVSGVSYRFSVAQISVAFVEPSDER